MKTRYSFTVLRYVHDIGTGEFANVGVALYAPEAKYLGAMCTPRYGRLSKMFLDVNGDYFRSLMRYIETRFEELADRLRSELPLDKRESVMGFATEVLPRDDSSLQWSEPGAGVTSAPAATLDQIYERMVEKYAERQKASRTDEEVWRVFRRELETKEVMGFLEPKRIAAEDYDYEFGHAWLNRVWHVYEPVSFDLQEADSVLDKANRWLGRITILRESPDEFKLYMLFGEPSLERLRPVFIKAKNILTKMPGEKEFIGEREAETFSSELARELAARQHR